MSTLATAPAPAHAAPQRPALRLVPTLPEPEPVQLTFDFDWEIAPGLPAVPPAPRHLRLVHGGQARAISDDDILGMPQASRWVARLALAIYEVSCGLRPAGQLARYVSKGELSRISNRGSSVSRHPSARARAQVSGVRQVRSIRLCPITDKVVEVTAVVAGGERARAIGMRMAKVGSTWQVTDIALP